MGREPLSKGLRRATGPLEPTTAAIGTVIRDAQDKYEAGRDKYGQLDLTTDQRDYLKEAEEELLDAINYLVFQVLRLRALR